MENKNWPAWFNGPNGETKIFYSPDEVPADWTTGAEKRSVDSKPATPPPSPPPSAPGDKPANAEIDAHGHPWSANLHAASKGKTTAGLWRMAVGKSRPDPLPGFPKPPLDL